MFELGPMSSDFTCKLTWAEPLNSLLFIWPIIWHSGMFLSLHSHVLRYSVFSSRPKHNILKVSFQIPSHPTHFFKFCFILITGHRTWPWAFKATTWSKQEVKVRYVLRFIQFHRSKGTSKIIHQSISQAMLNHLDPVTSSYKLMVCVGIRRGKFFSINSSPLLCDTVQLVQFYHISAVLEAQNNMTFVRCWRSTGFFCEGYLINTGSCERHFKLSGATRQWSFLN